MKQLKFLLLILLAITFASCYSINDPCLPEQEIRVYYLNFVKFTVRSSFDNKFSHLVYYETTECTVGDTIGLSCGIYDGIGTYWINLPESVTATITSSKGDIEFVKLFDNPNVGYLAPVPPPPRNYIDYTNYLPEPSIEHTIINELVSNSQDGDILTAEIRGKNQTLRATLTVKRGE